MPVSFPILAKEGLLKAAQDVAARFDGSASRSKTQTALFESIAEPLSQAAVSRAAPSLVAEFNTYDKHDRKDGTMSCVKAKGQIFTFHQKMIDGVLELRCYPGLSPQDFNLNKLRDGGVEKLYGQKDGADRITLDVGARWVRVYMNGKQQDALDGDWGRGLAETALALINRARAADKQDSDVVEIEPGVTQQVARRKSLSDVILDAKPKLTPGPLVGDDLVDAKSWRGQPVVVTSDRSGANNVHVMLERRDASGNGVWWPVTTPTVAHFPQKGCAVVLDGDQLQLLGGVDASGNVLNDRWVLDLQKGTWKQGSPLKDGVAWPAAAVDDKDAFVVGGVAGYYLKRTDGGDQKVQQSKRSMQVGGYPNWRDRASAPAETTGSSALVDKGAVFVGPGAAKDGAVVVYDTNEQEWVALPKLPVQVGMGQLSRSGSELVYTGGFTKDGSASTEIYALNLDDMFGGWTKKGDSDAVAGAAKIVDRAGKKVAILVAPQGAVMAHLE